MTRSTPKVAAGLGMLFALLPACLAHAATKTVYMGVPPAGQKALSALSADVNAYFPDTITVRRGDKVRFLPVGGHTVDFPARGRSAAQLVTAGAPIAGATDPAGIAYWFNGQPNLQLTPSLLTLSYGKTVSYGGGTEVQSGLPLESKAMTVRFTKAGTYTYFCNIHNGMKGTVRVLGAGARVASAKTDAKAVKSQIAAAVKQARGLQSVLLPRNTIQLGNSSRSGVEILAMFPGTMDVKVGTTITFSMSRWSFAAHTATTGPGDPLNDPSSFLGKISDSIRNVPPFDEAGVYPSDPRGIPAALTPALHGNGFWNSGFMDRSNATPQPKNQQVKIVTPGTYTFYCMLHPFMSVAVTAS